MQQPAEPQPISATDLADVWSRAIADLNDPEVRPHQRAWLSLTRPIALVKDTALVAAPNTYARDYLEVNLRPLITETLSHVLGRKISIAVSVQPIDAEDRPWVVAESDDDEPHVTGYEGILGTPDLDPQRHLGLNEKFTFDSFVQGSSNRFAHAAAVAVAETPAHAYNPLFIYGESGLGKTHLLHAIGNYSRQLRPNLRIRYVSSEEFTSDFIRSVRVNDVHSFQEMYRDVDLLLIDDIQFLERAEQTQEAFFHTFNALQLADKQIVISSDRKPDQLAGLRDRLVTRFQSGLVADVQVPDLELRTAILQKKADNVGMSIKPAVMNFIASRVQRNVRELEGALIRVVAFGSLNKQEVDLKLAEIVLKDLLEESEHVEVSVDRVIEATAQYFGLDVAEVVGASRKRNTVQARYVAMHLCRELTGESFAGIGDALNRDATTVAHGDKQIRDRLATDASLARQLDQLSGRIWGDTRTDGNGPAAFVSAVLDTAARAGVSQGEAATNRYAPPNTADTYTQLGRIAFSRGDYSQSASLYQRALQMHKQNNNGIGITDVLRRLGSTAQAQGNLEHADIFYRESLAVSSKLGDVSGVAETLYRIGLLEKSRGRTAEAESSFSQALESAVSAEKTVLRAELLQQLAILSDELGDLKVAEDLYGESLKLCQKPDTQVVKAETLRRLGGVAQRRGDLLAAEDFYFRSLEALGDRLVGGDGNI